MPHDLHARPVHRLADPPVAREREAGHVRREAQPRRAGLLGQRGQLARRVARAHDEVRAAPAQRRPQFFEAAEQEAAARPGLEAAVEQGVVEHEHRHDVLGSAGGGGQRRMVVHAQIAPEPDDLRVCHRR